MSQVITAPNKDAPQYLSVFLAGGITNCKEWQKQVISELELEDVTLFNPRRDFFDIADKFATKKQIAWEYNRLETADIFSMYFCNDNSDQPICMYELGRNVLRMQNRFPSDWENRIVVSVEDGYSRSADVIMQLRLCATKLFVDNDATPEKHAGYIRASIRKVRRQA
jgi:hypothetical protein